MTMHQIMIGGLGYRDTWEVGISISNRGVIYSQWVYILIPYLVYRKMNLNLNGKEYAHSLERFA